MLYYLLELKKIRFVLFFSSLLNTLKKMLDWHGSSSQQSSRKRAGPSGCKVFFPSTVIDTRESKTPSIGNKKVQPCSGLINFEFVQPSLPRRLADVHNSSSMVNQKKELYSQRMRLWPELHCWRYCFSSFTSSGNCYENGVNDASVSTGVSARKS